MYTAQLFRPNARCLEAYAPVALVEADELGAACEPTCLTAGDELYVSTVCAPYPRGFTIEEAAESALCEEALASLREQRFCD